MLARLLFLSVLVLIAPAWAQRPSVLTPLSCDLDGDGIAETIALRPFLQQGVELGQLIVMDAQGKIVWSGATESANPQNPQEPDIFLGEFDLGDLEAVGDFAGNGRIRLLGTYQKSDVRPTRFRLFEWNGQGFVHLRSGSLLPAPQRPATFVWKDAVPEAQVWIESFLGVAEDGRLPAIVTDLTSGEQTRVLLDPQGEEFVLSLP
jgi:hypothetical protein